MWAVIDIGSNTIRLVIYLVEDGRPRAMLNKKYPVGLAGYIDETNRIQPEGVQVLLEALTDVGTILKYIQPACVLPFGTAALRNSANGEEIVRLIQERCGLNVEVLTGEEEAVMDYYGARQDGIGESGLLVDVGGGSTELTFFTQQKIVFATSIPLGSLNLYKSYVKKLIPGKKEVQRIKKAVREQLQMVSFPGEDLTAQPIYCVGGTARAALRLMGKKYALGDSNAYTLVQLREFLGAAKEDPRGLVQDVLRTCPDRVHTLIPGLLVFQTIAKYFGTVSFVTSRYGVREGYLMRRIQEKEQQE